MDRLSVTHGSPMDLPWVYSDFSCATHDLSIDLECCRMGRPVLTIGRSWIDRRFRVLAHGFPIYIESFPQG